MSEQLSMSMFATRADYDAAVRAQPEQPTGLQLAVKLLAQIGDDDSDRAIAAVHDLADEHAQRLALRHHAADLAQRVADLEAIVSAPRGTDAQITEEREISAAAIDGALAFGYQGCDAPEAGHWLLAAHNAGKRIAELEAERDAMRARLAEIEAQEPVAWQCRFASDGGAGWSSCSKEHYAMVREETSGGFARDGYEVRGLYAAAVPAQAVPDASRAEAAGHEHAIGHLGALVEAQRLLLVDVEDICGRDGHGGQFEDGESEIIDRVRAHLATMAVPEAAR